MVNKNLYKQLEEVSKEIEGLRSIEELDHYSRKILEIDIFYKNSDIVSNAKVIVKNYLCKLLMAKTERLTKIKSEIAYPSLNNILSKHLFNAEKMHNFTEIFPLINRNIGQIPSSFLKKIPIDQRKNCCKEIYDLLSEYALKMNFDYDLDYDNCNKKENYIKPPIEELEEKLSKIIKQKVRIKYQGCGFNGNGFKLTIGCFHYFYKVFFLYRQDDSGRLLNHGGLAEPQMALFANKNSPKNKFSKFYFGRIGYGFYVDSFLVSEFVERKSNYIPRKELLIESVGINETEMHKFDNTINGKIVDFGGIKTKIPELEDKKVRNLVRIISNNINYSYNQTLLSATWVVKKKNISTLKKYIAKIDIRIYKKALDIISKYKINFPKELAEKLENIKECENSIKIINTLNTKHIFNNNINEILSNANYYNIEIKTKQEPIEAFNSPGHVILQIYNDIQCVCFYASDGNVFRIRLEKLIDNSFKTIVELDNPECIKQFENKEFYKLLI